MDDVNEKFNLIYDQYIQKIYRFVYLKVNSQELAEDITSRVFLKGWETLNAKKSIRSMGSFLYQISRNMVVDHYREKGRTKTVSPDHIPEMIDMKMDLYEKVAIDSDLERIKKVLQNIKKEYQDVVILHYIEDMSPSEISDIIAKPVGTVRVMIHRGLKMLKDELVQES